MIDTHTHLYYPDYGEAINDILARAQELGVSHFVLPNVNEESVAQVRDFHSRFPHVTSMAMGIHPTDVKDNWEEFIPIMEKELSSGDYVAVGEVGIDLYWDKSTLPLQLEAFQRQLTIAMKYQLPVIIHCREAIEETMEVIEKIRPNVPLIFHSFTGNSEDIRRIRKGCDPFFGINGVVTYKNAPALRDAIKEIGLNKILLETDAPYLTPVPHRGKRNDSSFLPFIRDKIAEVLELDPSIIDKITDENAKAIFNISD
ncbi:MAG: TatD family hydrolase [Muribaculaceae bacterium]|nr:TatD family hydrolase [Muribaculaceae bacterium]